jgi:hypothetical protein
MAKKRLGEDFRVREEGDVGLGRTTCDRGLRGPGSRLCDGAGGLVRCHSSWKFVARGA